MKTKRPFFMLTILVISFVLMASLVGIHSGRAANLVQNPGFETGSLSPWGSWNNSVVTGNAHSGTYAMRDGTAAGSGEQTISGLSPNTTYTLTGWVKTSATSVTASVGVKNFGGTETSATSTSTTYTQKTVTFTTGASNTSATIYCYKPTTSGYVYCDDFTLDVAAGSPTNTPTKTSTPVPPTPTRTNTPVPPTPTRTNTPTGTNYAVNPGFETGSLSPWGQWNDVSVVSGNARSGTYSLRAGNSQASSEQTVSGLTANTVYNLSGWAKLASGSSGNIVIGVKSFGGTEIQLPITSTSYTQATSNFTTGASNTSAVIYCYRSTGTGYAYCDDFSVTYVGGAPTPTNTPTQVLVWSDEFNDTTKDTSKWGYEIGYIRNNEAQYYTDRIENSYEDGSGVLTIKAIRESYQGYAYTSASLNTKGKASWTYGTFEMRARIPTALGTWPAWWWLGTNIDSVGWPACGEIDMMEFYRSTALYNVMDSGQHWFNYTENFTDSTNYHIWRMEWASANSIKLYRDGVLKNTYTGGDAAFSRPGYLLINLAIGGNSGGDPSGTTFPQYYYIDYIRVYQ